MESIAVAVIGIVCIVIGIANRKGNVSMLHSYHRNRVSEADRIPFGKMVGLGMIIIGIAMLIAGALTFVSESLQSSAYLIASYVIMGVGLVSGLGLNFYAMIKYNKGIF